MRAPVVPPATSRLEALSRRRLWAAAASLALVVVACADTTSTDDDTIVPTALLVAPADFLGSAVCLDAPGAVRLYQATLIDVTDDLAEPFALASSDVLGCTSTAYFGYVRPGRRYIAHVEAFDRTGLVAQRPGVRLVVDDTGQAVTHRFFSVCRGEDDVSYGGASGEGAAGSSGTSTLGAQALLNSNVYVRGCTPFVDTGELGPTGISISLEASLLGLSCGNGPGQIERFVVQTASTEEPEPPSAGGAGGAGGASGEPDPHGGVEASCTEAAEILDLMPGLPVSYEVLAFEPGQTTASFRTTCRAFTVAGVIVPARCEPLGPWTP